jgi:PAS domain S-box-containing protein
VVTVDAMENPGTGRKKKIDVTDDVNLKDLLNQHNHIYGQLSALKHIVYSSISLSDPDSLTATVSLQIKDYLTASRNAIWYKDSRGRFVKTALNGKLLPPDERTIIEDELSALPDDILSDRMKVLDPAAADSPIASGFRAPSLFPFKSNTDVTGFLVVDEVASEERDVFQFIAHFSGMILNISLLHQEVEKKRADLEEMTGLLMVQNEQMSALHHVGIEIAVAPDPAAICGLITDTLIQDLGAQKAAAFLLDEHKNELYCVAEAGELKTLEQTRLKVEEQSSIGVSLASGRIVTHQDHSVTLDIGDNQFENWSLYPLKCKDRNIGVVVAETEDEENNDQAAILINHAGVVIDTLMVLDKVSEEREQLSDTLSSIGDGVITTDLQGRITLMNKIAENLTGCPLRDARGQHLNAVFCIMDEQTRTVVQDTLETALKSRDRPESAYHILLKSRDGTERPVVKSGTPIKDTKGRNIGTVIIFKDITDLQRLEEELLRVRKLESLGVMAGGLAHDFNNLLTVILGNINLAQMSFQPDDSGAKSLAQAEQSIHKARDLTQKFITFASGGTPFKRKTVIDRLLKDTADLVLSGSNVKCEFSLPDNLWPVEMDKEQMRQVLYNILENAKLAMPQGGEIQCRAENCMADETRIENGLHLLKGQYVLISITDQGVGIEEKNLQKIFDPYFSTRDRGTQKGMGLGLAIAHSVIRKHRGDIRVDSRPGEGTHMHIYLPAAGEQLDVAPSPEPKDAFSMKKRVLFMDDEDFIRELAAKSLTILGYESSMARDGDEAIALYVDELEKRTPFGAVILDLTIPGGMGGKEVAEKLKEIDPNVRVVVSSGYASDPIMSAYRDAGFVGALPKPYNLEQLKGVLAHVFSKSK